MKTCARNLISYALDENQSVRQRDPSWATPRAGSAFLAIAVEQASVDARKSGDASAESCAYHPRKVTVFVRIRHHIFTWG
jgi:hypothetical protein